jgi:hypothetical protein
VTIVVVAAVLLLASCVVFVGWHVAAYQGRHRGADRSLLGLFWRRGLHKLETVPVPSWGRRY